MKHSSGFLWKSQKSNIVRHHLTRHFPRLKLCLCCYNEDIVPRKVMIQHLSFQMFFAYLLSNLKTLKVLTYSEIMSIFSTPLIQLFEDVALDTIFFTPLFTNERVIWKVRRSIFPRVHYLTETLHSPTRRESLVERYPTHRS
mgnify:CR=1 FL=1